MSGSTTELPPVMTSPTQLRALLDQRRAQGATVGLVGTSGGLHGGHLSLVRRSVEAGDLTVLWLFTGKSAVADAASTPSYARDYDRDQQQALDAGAAVVFRPPNESLFPHGAPLVRVQVDPSLAEPWPGSDSVAFVNMVATTLAKSMNIIGPCRLYCGEKDWQNAAVLTRMVADLSMSATVVPCPSVREPDGLVMGSRNVKLTPAERAQAPRIKQALDAAVRAIEAGEADPRVVETLLRTELSAIGKVEYAAVVGAHTLAPVAPLAGDLRILVSVGFSGVSLMDNVPARAPRPAP
jgi:pantoate--beta-alanine ligase